MQNVTEKNEEGRISGGTMVATIDTSEAPSSGRYLIERIIMEGDTVPLLSLTGPYFASNSVPNITAVTGSTAILQCSVHNLGNQTVSAGL